MKLYLKVVKVPQHKHNGMHTIQTLYVARHSLHFSLHYCSQLYSLAVTNSDGHIGDFNAARKACPPPSPMF